MIYYVEVENDMNETLRLPLSEEALTTGLVISNIEGIGLPKANINLVDVVGSDKKKYNSAVLDKRNIVMSLYLSNDAMTIEEARHLAYKYFPVKSDVKLTFCTDTRTLYITGHVESNDPAIFEQSETQQISIICDDPFFYLVEDPTPVTVVDDEFYGMIPKFTFPFCNHSMTEDELIFAEYNERTEKVIYYDGEEETGLGIEIHFVNPTTNLSIINSFTGERIVIDGTRLSSLIEGSSQFNIGDTLYISTDEGNRKAMLDRDGKVYNALPTLVKRDWLIVRPGENVFVLTSSAAVPLNVTCKFSYKVTYLGV